MYMINFIVNYEVVNIFLIIMYTLEDSGSSSVYIFLRHVRNKIKHSPIFLQCGDTHSI